MILHLVGGILTSIAGICLTFMFLSTNRSLSPVLLYALAFAMLMYAASPLMSALFIVMRTWRWFSILVALLYAPLIPFGTIIAIFSLWVLLAPTARTYYQ